MRSNRKSVRYIRIRCRLQRHADALFTEALDQRPGIIKSAIYIYLQLIKILICDSAICYAFSKFFFNVMGILPHNFFCMFSLKIALLNQLFRFKLFFLLCMYML